MDYTHQQIESLFSAALERETVDERGRFLDDTCGGDETLRGRVETLLENFHEAGDFLEKPAAAWVPLDDELVEDVERLPESIPSADRAVLATPSKAADETLAPYSPEVVPHGPSFLDPPTQQGTLGRLGDFEVLERISAGGMGIVLKARDTVLRRIVAIKVLGPQLANDTTARLRFLREAQSAAAVNHPHVVSIYTVQEANGFPYLVMEHIEGGTLQDKLEREGQLSVSDIVRIGLQTALGLASAHQSGLIHRDIKPGNILLKDGEQVSITDFGLAHAADDVSLTQTGAVTGTPQFMSPEQAEGLPLTARSDLFSFGIVLYAMCTGRSPFAAPGVLTTLRSVCESPPQPVHEVNSEIPVWLSQLIGCLLAKKPEKRCLSAANVAEELRAQWIQLRRGDPLIAGVRCTGECNSCLWGIIPQEDDSSAIGGVAAPSPDKLPSAATASAAASRRRPWLIAAAIAAVAGLSVWAGTILLRTSDGEYVLETDDPQIAAQLGPDGGIVVHDLKTDRTYTLHLGTNRLPTGDHELTVTTPDGLELTTPQFRIKRSERVAASVRAVKRTMPASDIASSSPPGPPAVAIAPFDAKQARRHQAAWAEYLGVPIEHENSIGMKLQLIPPGEFTMGAPDSDEEAQPGEKPQHKVTLTKPFQMGATEVTIGQFRQFVDATNYVTEAESDGGGSFRVGTNERRAEYIWNGGPPDEPLNHPFPVRGVGWEDARQFCVWLSHKENRVYRLPTDAEWEFACRAGTTTRYWFGDTFDPNLANVSRRVSPVRQYAANPFGLFDTHGNVHESCLDSGREFTSDAMIDPIGPRGETVVVRGGAVSSSPSRLRSSQRYLNDGRRCPEIDFATTVKGFRAICEIPVPKPTPLNEEQ